MKTDPIALGKHCGVACLQNGSAPYAGDDLIAAIVGQPTWSNARIGAIQRDRGAAHALAMAYKELGDDFLTHLHGAFALAIIEPQVPRVVLAVDRLGIVPLAWHILPEGIAFASRADALGAHPDLNRELSDQALFNYFYFEMVPGPETVFSGTRKLLPGQCLSYGRDGTRIRHYWALRYHESPRPTTELNAELHSLLEQCVADSVPDHPTGTFLSGGLDSSTVTGLFARIAPAQADAYSIGFDAEGYDEMAYARVTARHFGVNLHELYVTPSDVADALPLISSAYDEPFGNASAIPAYYCARLAKEDGKRCLLAGDGGDEIFAGNARYAKQKLFGLYERVPAFLRGGLLEPLAFRLPLNGYLWPLRKLRSYIEQAKIPMPERMETYNFLHRSPLEQLFTAEFLGDIDADAPAANRREVYDRTDGDAMLQRMLHLDLKLTIADNDLRKVNRTSELAGIEVRYPMLDQRLVEFAAGIPVDTLLKGFELRSFYRRAMKGFLAPQTLTKRKHGFGLPFGLWMQRDQRLKELAHDLLEAFRKRDILQPQYLDDLLEAHRAQHADYYGVMIWRVLMLEQWMQTHAP